jgi:acetyl esterase/lipase
VIKRSYLSISVLLFILIAAARISAQDGIPSAEIEVDYAVIYGQAGGQELQLDVHRPSARENPRPAIVIFHAGGGLIGDREWTRGQADGLARGGYVAFNVGYRLLGDDEHNPWPAQLDDAQLAVRWVRSNAAAYNVDPDRICAFGVSFGGKLAALLGMRDTAEDSNLALSTYSSRVSCVVSAAGNLDPTQQPLDLEDRNAIMLLGGTLSEVPERYEDYSPLAQVRPDTAPFLVFHGGADQYVSLEEPRQFVNALHEAGIEVTYAEFPTADHFYWFEWASSAPRTLRSPRIRCSQGRLRYG